MRPHSQNSQTGVWDGCMSRAILSATRLQHGGWEKEGERSTSRKCRPGGPRSRTRDESREYEQPEFCSMASMLGLTSMSYVDHIWQRRRLWILQRKGVIIMKPSWMLWIHEWWFIECYLPTVYMYLFERVLVFQENNHANQIPESQTPLPPTSPSITVIKHREVFSLITVTTMLFCACTERERACSKSEVKQKWGEGETM